MPTPDPDPTPVPVPVPGRVTARCSVQAGDTLSPETGLRPQTAILSGEVDTVEYFIDSGKVATSMAAPSYGAIIDIRSYAPGAHTFGFVCYKAGVAVLDLRAYPVTIASNVPPAPTNAELRDLADSEFRKTTDPYPKWVALGKPDTHWKKGFDALGKIK